MIQMHKLCIAVMLYLVTGEWIDDPTVSGEEFPTLWEHMVRPSLEALSKMADDKKMCCK
jgi:hypothetical protein